jgi:hypothetical protein
MTTPRLDSVLGETWSQMWPQHQRSLALLGHCYTLERRLAAGEKAAWSELDSNDRMAIIRAMRLAAELAELCAEGLALARESLDEHWREELDR